VGRRQVDVGVRDLGDHVAHRLVERQIDGSQGLNPSLEEFQRGVE
jgi:hypothetical protein